MQLTTTHKAQKSETNHSTESPDKNESQHANAATAVILADIGKESVASAYSLTHRWASSSETSDISTEDLTTVLLAGPVAKAIVLEETTGFPVTPVRLYVSEREAKLIPKGWRRDTVLRRAIDSVRLRWDDIRVVAGKLDDGYTLHALAGDGMIQKLYSKGRLSTMYDIDGTRTIVMSG